MTTETLSLFINTFVGLFVMIDPFAVLPVYLSLSDRFSKAEKQKTRRKATLIAFGIICAFTATGLGIFKVFGITLPAFQIAGGLLLLRIGIDQLNHNRERLIDEEENESSEKSDISVFPLALPLLAGPGAISTVVLYSSQATTKESMISLYLAIFLVFVSTYLILKSAPIINRFLGHTGLNLLTRLMGIILTAIGVQFIINGIHQAYGI